MELRSEPNRIIPLLGILKVNLCSMLHFHHLDLLRPSLQIFPGVPARSPFCAALPIPIMKEEGTWRDCNSGLPRPKLPQLENLHSLHNLSFYPQSLCTAMLLWRKRLKGTNGPGVAFPTKRLGREGHRGREVGRKRIALYGRDTHMSNLFRTRPCAREALRAMWSRQSLVSGSSSPACRTCFALYGRDTHVFALCRT